MGKLLRYILLIFTMLLWAANFHVVKIALDYYPSLSVATFRFLFGVITLLVVLSINWRKNYFLLLQLSKKDWWYLFLLGFFGIFLTIYFFNEGLKRTNAINGSIIIATTPTITGFLALIFLKQSLSLKQCLAVIMSFMGVVTILIKGDFYRLLGLEFEKGDVYILGMATVFSCSQILISKYLTQINSVLMTTIASFFALVLFTLFSVPEIITYAIPHSFNFWLSILFMGILGSGLAHTAFYYTVVKLGTGMSSLSMNLIPLFTILLAFPFGEKVYITQILGGFLVILSLIIYNLSKYKTRSI